jgi:Fz domain
MRLAVEFTDAERAMEKTSLYHHLFHVLWVSYWSHAASANLVSSGILPSVHRPDCFQSVATCVPLVGSECFGASLPYHYSAPGSFVPEIANLTNVSEHLKLWSALRSVPQCWEVIQPLLCAVYIPRCQIMTVSTSGHNVSTGGMTMVQMPSRELCEVVQTPCRVIELYGGWPSYLRCDRPHFNKGCSVSSYFSFAMNAG